MFSHLVDAADGDQVVFVRSAEGHSHLVDNEKTKNRYKVGDEVAIAAIVKITAILPQNSGTVSYSTDRGISIHEELLEQIKIKPREQPKKSLYSGMITAISVRPAGQNSPDAYNRIGRVFEFKDGLLVGDRNALCSTYGFALQPEFTYESFDDFTKHHTLNDWLELKS